MKIQTMMRSRQESSSPPRRLSPGQSLRLRATPQARRLIVAEGRLWLTGEGSPAWPPDDVWLHAGESLLVPAGQELVADAHPHASFRLRPERSTCEVVQCRGRRGRLAALGARLLAAWRRVVSPAPQACC